MKNEREGKRGTEGSILDPDTAPEDLLEVTEDEHQAEGLKNYHSTLKPAVSNVEKVIK